MYRRGFLFVDLESYFVIDLFCYIASQYQVKASIFTYNTDGEGLASIGLMKYIRGHNIDVTILCKDKRNMAQFDSLEIVCFSKMPNTKKTVILEMDRFEHDTEFKKYVPHFRIDEPMSENIVNYLFGKGEAKK